MGKCSKYNLNRKTLLQPSCKIVNHHPTINAKVILRYLSILKNKQLRLVKNCYTVLLRIPSFTLWNTAERIRSCLWIITNSLPRQSISLTVSKTTERYKNVLCSSFITGILTNDIDHVSTSSELPHYVHVMSLGKEGEYLDLPTGLA